MIKRSIKYGYIQAGFFSILLLSFLLSLNSGFSNQKALIQKLSEPIPAWMQEQIQEDLASFYNRCISINKISNYFHENPMFAKYTIANNKVLLECEYPNLSARTLPLKTALETICEVMPMPNVVLVMSLDDSLHAKPLDIPLFAMAKTEDSSTIILLPDFEALSEGYQVLKSKHKDVTQIKFWWEKKHPKLIWRGSTAQHSMIKYDFGIMTKDNFHLYSRVTLCELSLQFPYLIDAKFTMFAQGGDNIPFLEKYKGARVSFEEQIKYKYHMLIDGNSSAYSNSCWKFFINSLVFKEDSYFIQWYHKALRPYVHYIPIQEGLGDLKDKIEWAMSHDNEAKKIAANLCTFANSSLTITDNYCYLYGLILAYSKLHFVE